MAMVLHAINQTALVKSTDNSGNSCNMRDNAFKYRVFLSYSHEDNKWARWLHRALENYRVPAHLTGAAQSSGNVISRIAPVFRDRDELPTSANLSDTVNKALAASESLVVICSPNAVKSRWVNEEILNFKRFGRVDRIFCFIVDGEPLSGGDSECFPEALRFELDESGALGQVTSEPLAADARAYRDGRKAAKLKLIAGLLGVGFNDLRQRELQRHNRRLLAITAGSLLISFVTIGLAIMTFLANAEAERRREQAEDLIRFMLGDLQEGLHEIGRLDIFMRVGDKAMDYFAALADEDVNDETLNQRSKALRQIGESRMDQGKTDIALKSFRESLNIAQRLANRDPQNAEWQIALANCHFYIGYLHWQRDELVLAREEFERVIPIVDRVSAGEPDEAEWLLERSYAYTNLGRVLELQGNLDKALKRYQDIYKINSRLVELQPDNPEYRLEVGFAHNNIGKLVESLGRLEEAETNFRQDLQIKREVSSGNPKHNLWQGYVATSERFMGRILTVRGSYPEARDHYRASITILDQLLRMEPSRAEYQEQKASSERELAALDRRQGDLGQAADRIDVSIGILESLLSVDAANANWQRGWARAQAEKARVAILNGQTEQASSSIESALLTLNQLLENEPTNLATNMDLADIHLVKGDLEWVQEDREAAIEHWTTALGYLDKAPFTSTTPRQLDLQSSLLVRSGREEEAEPLLARLRDMGYRSKYQSLVL